MAYSITKDCIGCGSCLKICPADAITGEKKELHTIDSELCIECGSCSRVCPKSTVLDSFGLKGQKISRKLWQKPVFAQKSCMACTICIDTCPSGCLELGEPSKKDPNGYPFLSKEKECLSCGFCAEDCPVEAITMSSPQT